MATVTFELKEFYDKGIEKQRLITAVPEFGMEIESVDESSVTIDITPNRPDLLDFTGMVRQLRYFTKKTQPREKGYRIKEESGISVTIDPSVHDVRPFAACMVVNNADLSGNALKNLINFTEKLASTYGRKRRKMAIGIHNLDTVEGSNLLYATSRSKRIVPLGEKRDMSFDQVMASTDKGAEYSSIIPTSGDPKFAFLEDKKKVLAMIPIINSEDTRVTESTKNLLAFVDGTSKKAVEDTLKILACSFIDSGATVSSCRMIYGGKEETTPDLTLREIRIRNSKIRKTIGSRLDQSEMISCANKMGYFGAKYGDYILAYVPPYRVDVLNEQDLIEDIAMGFGYLNIEPLPVMSAGGGTPDASSEYHNRLAKTMVGLGFTEAMNQYLTNERTNFENVSREYKKDEVISLMNSKTEAITMMRTDIIPSLLTNLMVSAKERMPQKIFEVGKVFKVENGKVVEQDRLAFVSAHSKANFSEAKSTIEAILMHRKGWTIEKHTDALFIEGRCAKAVANGAEIAVFGEIHPRVLSNFKIEEPVIAGEFVSL